jgi:hypothetical protein
VDYTDAEIPKDFSNFLASAKNNTVFVVHAASLEEFLERFDCDSYSL